MDQKPCLDSYFISRNRDLLDRSTIYYFLSIESYWAQGRKREDVEASIDNSTICYGVYKKDAIPSQVGFARVISDKVTFAYLADVFILSDHRGIGLSKMLMEAIMNDDDLKRVRKFMLTTGDAHTLYEKYGFKLINNPEWLMEKINI